MIVQIKKYRNVLQVECPKALAHDAREVFEEKTLPELRKEAGLSQAGLARTLEVDVSTVSKAERRTDVYVSTLRAFVEGMGGRLEIIATFPHKSPVKIKQPSKEKRIVVGEWPQKRKYTTPQKTVKFRDRQS